MKNKTLIITTALLLSVSPATAEIDFRSDQPVDFYNDIILKENKNLDLNNNEIKQFFDNACPDGEAIVDIDSNGSFECSTAAGAPGLPTILENNNVANQTINLDYNNLTGLENPEAGQDAVNLQYLIDNYVSSSGDTLEGRLNFQNNNITNPAQIQTGGTGNDQITIRDTNNSQDIARFKEGGNIEIPNGNLDISRNLTIDNLDKLKLGKTAQTWLDSGNSGMDGVFMQYTQGTDWSRIGIKDSSSDETFAVYDAEDSAEKFGSTGWQKQFEVKDSGKVLVHEGNLDLNGNNIEQVGKIDFNSGLSIEGDLNTSGGKIDTEGGNIALNGGYLSNNGDNEGIRINNSGDVRIQEGDLEVRKDSADIKINDNGSGSQYPTLWMQDRGENRFKIQWRDDSPHRLTLGNGDTGEILKLMDSGKIQVSNGDLDMDTNNIDNVNCLGDNC